MTPAEVTGSTVWELVTLVASALTAKPARKVCSSDARRHVAASGRAARFNTVNLEFI